MIQIIIGTVKFDLFLHQAEHPLLLKFLDFGVSRLKIWAFQNMFYFLKYDKISRLSFIPQFNAQGMIILSGYLQGGYNCHQEEFYFVVNPQAPVTFLATRLFLRFLLLLHHRAKSRIFLTETYFCAFGGPEVKFLIWLMEHLEKTPLRIS